MPTEITRPEVRCPSCSLNQFVTRNGFCRKCGKPLIIQVKPFVYAHLTPDLGLRNVNVGVPFSLKPRDIDIGAAVRLLRNAYGWTATAFAKKCGIPRNYISKVENDKVVPRIDMLEKFASVFDVTACGFITIATHLRYARYDS